MRLIGHLFAQTLNNGVLIDGHPNAVSGRHFFGTHQDAAFDQLDQCIFAD